MDSARDSDLRKPGIVASLIDALLETVQGIDKAHGRVLVPNVDDAARESDLIVGQKRAVSDGQTVNARHKGIVT
jgi:hypothetical protein